MEIKNISDTYTCLKQLTMNFSHQPQMQLCKLLLEAAGQALLKGESPEKLIQRISKKRNSKLINFSPLSFSEAQKDILEIKRLRRLAHDTPLVPGSRKLEKYHAELMILTQAKASCRDIKLWLFIHKKLVISHHSVYRYLKSVKDNNGQNF